MADQKPLYPEGTMMQKPDRSEYIYLQACEDLEPGLYVEPNVNGRLAKFKGTFRFPRGICTETVPKDWYTFVMVTEPVKKEEKPVIG